MAIQPISKAHSIFGACICMSGALALLWGLCNYADDVRMAFNAANWPTVQGKIISSDSVRGCGKGSSYYPQVHYQYVVDGKAYASQRIAFGNAGCGSNSSAQAIASRYVVNDVVLVHYNNDAQNESVLIVGGVLEDTWGGIVLMVVMLILSSWLASMFIRAWPRDSITKL